MYKFCKNCTLPPPSIRNESFKKKRKTQSGILRYFSMQIILDLSLGFNMLLNQENYNFYFFVRHKDTWLLEKHYVSPIHWWVPKGNPCNGYKYFTSEWFWANFTNSPCYEWLENEDSYAWTVYTSSWNRKSKPLEIGRLLHEAFSDFTEYFLPR
jgi:hypothetical protein